MNADFLRGNGVAARLICQRLCWLLCLAGASVQADPPRVAIVIDDVGFQRQVDERALDLDLSIALAIIPESPLAGDLARQANRQNREVWIHLPLPGLVHDNCESGLTCLDPGWGPLTMRNQLLRQLALVPGAIGINNHQGSAFTADTLAVTRLINAIDLINRDRPRPLIVMDSRTSPHSQFEYLARRRGMATLRRRVFLDHSEDPAELLPAWQRLIEEAQEHGSAIAIGHSRLATLDFLEQVLGGLAAAGIELVPPSALISAADRGPIPPGSEAASAYPP
jgi:polysaccharide deacetylase 2 family uncharacterized protein YibQ